jgi:hypothetical protein
MKTSDLAYELRCATKRTDLPDEIVRLLSEAYEQLDRYKNGYEGGCHACEIVAVRNQELLAERDLARREVCRWEANHLSKSVTECARLNEWDCFREDGK